MRAMFAAVAVLLLAPAAAVAAPWQELPFHPLGSERTGTCVQAVGGGRVAVTVGSAGAARQAVQLLRPAADGTLAVEGAGTGPRFGFSRVYSSPQCPSVAVAASGAAVAAEARGARDEVVVATREPGGDFAAPLRVRTRSDVESVYVAVAPSGAAVVVWNEDERFRVVRRTAGSGFGAPETVRRAGFQLFDAAVGIDDAGRVTIAWLRIGRLVRGDVRREGQSFRQAVEVSTAAPGAAFGVPQRLRGRFGTFEPWFNQLEPPELTVAADGGALLAFRGDEAISIFERAPGIARFTLAAEPAVRAAERPAIGLAPGGAGIVAWRRGSRTANRWHGSLEVLLRAPGGAFQPPQLLSEIPSIGSGWSAFAPPPSFAAAGALPPPAVAVGADGSVVAGWLEAPLIAGGDAPVRAAMAVGSVHGDWEGARLLGGPGRSVDSIAVLADPAVVVWADNLTDSESGFELRGTGRLHRALPGAAAADPPAPSVTLRAPRQRIRRFDPVKLLARCSAACDLRAVAGRLHRSGTTDGFGNAQLDGPGEVALTLYPVEDRRLAPRGDGPLRVTVTGTAPGGLQATVARLDVDVRSRR